MAMEARMLERLPFGAAAVDSQGRVAWSNPAAVRLLRLDPGSPVPAEIPLREGGVCELGPVELQSRWWRGVGTSAGGRH